MIQTNNAAIPAISHSDSAHILKSLAAFAEGRAKGDAPNEAASLRLQSVADRLRRHAQELSSQMKSE